MEPDYEQLLDDNKWLNDKIATQQQRIAELEKSLKQIASHDDSEYCMSSIRNIARSALLREGE